MAAPAAAPAEQLQEQVFPWLKSLPLAPEYRPSPAEFKDPIAYIFKIEKEASKYGICKIIPPFPPASKKTTISNFNRSLEARSLLAAAEGSVPRPTFTTRQQQIGFCPRKQRPAQRPVWQSGEEYTFGEFEAKAKSFERNYLKKCGKRSQLSPLEIETLYWKATVDKPFSVEYANDMPGSAFVPVKEREGGFPGASTSVANLTVGETAWNMRRVSRAEGSLLRFMKEEIPGVTSPMVYIAMMFSWFAWHVEDHDLHSLNYLHLGAGKTWYGVPKEAAVAFEEVVRVQGYGGELNPLVTFATLGEKTTVMSPEVFVRAGIPCCRLVQNPGEFVVTFPRAYHSGFSHGFNCGEAANIATPEWLRMAKDAAIRRAAINYPPMVSHFQLLYDLALALCSRVPMSLSAKPRSSRLKEKKKSEGEKLTKELFVQNVIKNNELLHILGKGSSVVLLPRSSSDISVCSDLRVGSQLRMNSKMPLGFRSYRDPSKSEGLNCESNVPSYNNGIKPMKGFVSVKEKFTSLCERNRNSSSSKKENVANTNTERESTVQADGLSDQRLFSCVTCGVLSFDCVAIVQPREAAARYLMSADCSFFNDWTVGSGISSTGLEARVPQLKPLANMIDKSHPDYLYDVPVQSVNYQVKLQDQSSEAVSDTKAWKDGTALGLLASTYGDSSDSEEDHTEPDVPLHEGETKVSERNYDQDGTCVGEASCHVINCHEEPGFGQTIMKVRDDQTFDGSVETNSDKLACRKMNGLEGTPKDSAFSCATEQKRFVKGSAPMVNLDTPFVPKSDEDSSRMHVFCLEHAVEVEQQLQPIGGVHIMLLCHPEYPKIEAEAKLVAQELKIDQCWNNIEFQGVTREDEERIQSALDSEETLPGNSDWAVKLGINLFYSAILSRSPLYSKQMPYNSVIYDAFGRSSLAGSPAKSDGLGRKSSRQKKFVAGKWCGKVWMSNHVHPFLAQQDPDEEEQERNFLSRAILDEGTERKLLIRRNETTMVTRKYSRKRRTVSDNLPRKKAKSLGMDEDVVSDDTSEDHSYKENWRRASGNEQDSYYEREDAVSGDSLDRISDQRLRSSSRRRRDKDVESEDNRVSEDELDGSSYPKHKGIHRGKQIREIESDEEVSDHYVEDGVSDDSTDDEAVSNDSAENSRLYDQHRRIPRSKQAKTTERKGAVLYDSGEDDSTRQRVQIQRSKQACRTGGRDDTSYDSLEDNSRQQQRRIPRSRQMKNIEDEYPEYYSPEDNLRRTPRSRQVVAALRPVKRETRQPVKHAKGGRTSKKQTMRKKKQETPRLSNVKDEASYRAFDSSMDEEPNSGPSTRLRKRTSKPSEDVETKSKLTGKKARSVSASKITTEEEEPLEYQCDMEGCTMSFASKQQLALHKRNICPVKGCGKTFFSHKYLVQHRRVHMDDRPLKCPWKGCKMTFKWAWARTEHIRVHTGARPYVCAEPGCGQTFRFVSDFSRHKRKTGHSVKKTKR